MRKKIIFFLILLLWQQATQATNPNSPEDDILPGVVVAKVRYKFFSSQSFRLNKLNLAEFNKIEPVFPNHSPNSPLSSIVRFHFSDRIPPLEMVRKLKDTGLFEYVEPVYVNKILGIVPNDTLFPRQFYLRQTHTDLAWTIGTGSPEVLIAIVDNGTDYTHPDLAAHLWTNLAEANGIVGVDDDGNGYIDDIHGWDFGNNDPDPSPGEKAGNISAHGTHTAGLAAAVTNNVTGIAGAGFSCSFMPIKVSEDDNVLQTPFGYEGIVYAADNGADIINCSWGHAGSFSQFEQDVINYAVSKGCLIVAAAGNKNVETLFYPASYAHVFAVAALNENDQKTSYSTYGYFVDVSAPGGDQLTGQPGLLSLYPVNDGSYGEMSGTSMAAPLVAGVMGLLHAEYPTWDILRCYRQVALTADFIDDKNPTFAGKLGTGKINAFRSLTEPNLIESPAKIHFFNASVSDSLDGDGDFLFERDETIRLSASYQNFSVSPGTNFLLRLSSPDSDIQVVDDIVQLSNFPADSILEIKNSLSFRISGNAQTHLAPLCLEFEIENGNSGADTVFVPIGRSAVLLLDDDGGKSIDEFYTFWLKELKVPFLRWDREKLGSPSGNFMIHFPMTIWLCEWAFPSLDLDDRAALAQFLDSGGDLFISGQDIGWDLADPNGEHGQYSENAKYFYENYLHSIYQNDNSLADAVIGVPGTIGQDLSFKIYQPGIPFHFQFPDWIEPNVGAGSCFCYENQKGAGVYFAGNHRVLNLGFGFEAVDGNQWDEPTRYSRRRMEFMQRVFRFLGPLRHKPITDAENDTAAAVMFRAEFAPLVERTDSLYLFYRWEFSQQFSRMPVYVSDSGVGTLVVHFENFSGEVEYYFQLKDPYFTFTMPVNAPEETFSFRFGADTEKPKIAHIPPQDIIAQNKPRKITVSVSDNLGVDPNSVKMYFSTEFFSDSLTMTPAGENLFVAEIPPPGVIADSVVYFFTASDLAKNPNRAKSEYFSYFIGRENFELGLDYWQPDTICWKLDDRESRSPMFCISTFPGGGYQKNTNASIYLIPRVLVRALKNVELIFWTKYEIDQGHDFGIVEAKLGSANLWQQIGDTFSGKVDNWEKIEISLNSFFADADDSLFLRFRFQSDSLQEKPMAGWFIDDVEFRKVPVTKILPSKISASSISKIFDVSPNFPNPFNSETRVKFRIAEPAKVHAKILNVKGQVVREIDFGQRRAGVYDFLWNGTNSFGERCTTGVYFFRLLIEKMNEKRPERLKKTVKMILLR